MKKSFAIDTRDPNAMSRFSFNIVPRPDCWPAGIEFMMRPYTDSRGYLAFAIHLQVGGGEWTIATDEEMDAFNYHCISICRGHENHIPN